MFVRGDALEKRRHYFWYVLVVEMQAHCCAVYSTLETMVVARGERRRFLAFSIRQVTFEETCFLELFKTGLTIL